LFHAGPILIARRGSREGGNIEDAFGGTNGGKARCPARNRPAAIPFRPEKDVVRPQSLGLVPDFELFVRILGPKGSGIFP
jgi:hypothetical protein